MKLEVGRGLAVVTSVALVLVVGGLIVQHLRHGWPFSLHHGLGGPAPVARVERSDSKSPTTHPRAQVHVPREQLETIGVRVEQVRLETLTEPIRAVATVVPDESRVSHVHTRVAGWIERLHVRTTGERVRAGQPLAGIFSQELLASQTEYLAMRRASLAGPRSVVVEGGRSRLKVLGMTDAEIATIEETGEPRRLVIVSAPRSGVVIHRGISVGTAVDPSTEIVTIADLSQVWVFAEVSESDIPFVSVGTLASLDFPASGHEPFEAKVDFLYPTLSERSRTLRVRFVAENRNGTLRPGLYGSATFRIEPRSTLTVSRDAIVDTGTAQHVFVALGEGRFMPQPVKLGARFDQRVEIQDGLKEGDTIVASGVFLIDSESRLRASGGTGHVHAKPESPRSASDPARATAPAKSPSRGDDEHAEHPKEPPPASTHGVTAPKSPRGRDVAPPQAPPPSGHQGH